MVQQLEQAEQELICESHEDEGDIEDIDEAASSAAVASVLFAEPKGEAASGCDVPCVHSRSDEWRRRKADEAADIPDVDELTDV